MKNIKMSRLFPKENENNLIKQYQKTKDSKIANDLFLANYKFIVKIAKSFQNYGLPIDDLIQEGSAGFIVSLNKFDSSKANSLRTYSFFWIKAYIINYILKNFSNGTYSITLKNNKMFFKINKLKNKFRNEEINGFYLTEQEILEKVSKELNIEQENVEAVDLLINNSFLSDSYLTKLDSGELSVESKVIEKDFLTKLTKKIEQSNLNKNEKILFYDKILSNEEKTFVEIGKKINLTPGRIQQINVETINKISNNKTILAFLTS